MASARVCWVHEPLPSALLLILQGTGSAEVPRRLRCKMRRWAHRHGSESVHQHECASIFGRQLCKGTLSRLRWNAEWIFLLIEPVELLAQSGYIQISYVESRKLPDEPASFEDCWGHCTQFGGNSEDSIEGAILKGLNYFGRYTSNYSVLWVNQFRSCPDAVGKTSHLVCPSRTSASPNSRPNCSFKGRKESKARPSRRRSCFRASSMNNLWFVGGSSTFGIDGVVVLVRKLLPFRMCAKRWAHSKLWLSHYSLKSICQLKFVINIVKPKQH